MNVLKSRNSVPKKYQQESEKLTEQEKMFTTQIFHKELGFRICFFKWLQSIGKKTGQFSFF